MPEIDILASNVEQTRTVAIQVKTKRSGTWQTTFKEWTTRTTDVAETRFWVFVDLHKTDAPPDYFIVPEAWIHADIDRVYSDYLKRHGGQRPTTPGSKHHAIRLVRIEQFRNQWELLGIPPLSAGKPEGGRDSSDRRHRGEPARSVTPLHPIHGGTE